jgi:ketosteroid isomerase-like protein
MAAGDLENIRKGLEAFNRRDAAAVMETCHPDVELVPVRAVFEGISYHGEEGLRQFFEDMDEEWTDMRADLDELREAGDQVVVLGRFRAKGKASGVEVDWPTAWVCDMRDGKTVRLQAYTDQAEALRVAGLA